MKKEIVKEDKRFKQCNKEVVYTIVFFIFNILLVFGLTFPFGYNVEASEIKLVAGFPKWYFYGVVISTGLLCISTYRSEEHTSELQSRFDLVCRLLLEKKKINNYIH